MTPDTAITAAPTRIEIPTLGTARLILRAPDPGDFEAYAAFRTDPVRTAGIGGPKDRDGAFTEFCATVGQWHVRGWGRFVLADRATGAPLGMVGPILPESYPEPELAWSVFAEAEGRGLAFEAAVAVRRWMAEAHGLVRPVSFILPTNHRSRALAERLGCTREDDMQHEVHGAIEVWRHPAP